MKLDLSSLDLSSLDTVVAKLPRTPRYKPTWVSEAVVVCTTYTHCACGCGYVAVSRPLLRFRHQRNHSLWEIRDHVGIQRPALPLDHRERVEQVPFCPACFGAHPSAPTQLELQL